MTWWVLNELSLHKQFSSPYQFVEALRALLKARNSNDILRASLRITPEIAQRHVCQDHTFRQAVECAASPFERQQVIAWIANHGPFWTADRPEIENDLFYFGGDDVTDTGLGEAARRRLILEDTEVMSFLGANAAFDAGSIALTHGLLEEPIGQIEVPNVVKLSELEAACIAKPNVPNNWTASLAALQQQFQDVWFSPNLADFLDGQPFVPYVHDRAVELIGVLSKIAASRDELGAWNDAGKHLYATHFVGEKAWFTDESHNNKIDFREEMSFIRQCGTKEMCPFHGKIKTPQYRIHFPWPLAVGKPIEIVYFGPKITKA
jgi:hypothetical protein